MKYVCTKDFEINGVVIGHVGDVLEVTDAKDDLLERSKTQPTDDELEAVDGYCDIKNTMTGEKFNATWMDIDDTLEEYTHD